MSVDKVKEWAERAKHIRDASGNSTQGPLSYQVDLSKLRSACLAYSAYLRGLCNGYTEDRGLDMAHMCYWSEELQAYDMRPAIYEVLKPYIDTWHSVMRGD